MCVLENMVKSAFRSGQVDTSNLTQDSSRTNDLIPRFLGKLKLPGATTVDGPNIQTHVSITVSNPRPPKVNVEHNLIEFVFPGFDLFRPFAETCLQDL